MLKRLSLFIFLTSALAATGLAQNTNSTTPQTRTRTSRKSTTTTTKPSNIEEQGAATPPQKESSNQNASRPRRTPQRTGAQDPGAKGVLAAFEDLLNGIRKADVDAAMSAYWKSPQLIFFNYNGTVTKGWEQMHQNRESSYPEMKDVRLETRDVRVIMLGRDGAVVTCLWTQSLTFRGGPETASGRMTLVFRRVGNSWKAVHLHTSPDSPDPSRVMPSEQTTAPPPRTTPTKPRP
jgi:ketosteroid isomerase-like protein